MVYHVQFPGLGLDLTINRVALAIGGFNIYWYGVIIAAGMLLAMLYAFRNAVDYGIDSDRLVDVVAIGTVMAIVCARIYYVAMAPFAYQSLWEMIDIRKGGIAIYGAVIGAFVFGGLAAKWRKVPLLPLFDLVSLGFLIGQGIGRWGNFVNQEAFGTNTTLPWGMYSEGTEAYLKSVQVTLPAGVTVDPAAPVHPTFLYESIWCLVGFAVLASIYKKRRFNGQIFLGYIIWYGLGRAWIEGLRTDSLLIGNTGLRASQLVAIGSVIVAATLMVIGLRNAKGKPLMVPLAVKDLKKQAGAEKKVFGSLELCFCELGEIEKLEKIYKKEELQAKAWLHLGWDGAGSDKRKDVKLQEKNIGYALQALHTAAALGCKRFLFSGSQAEYGICNEWMKEEQECHPVSEYGKDKVLVYQQATKAAKELGVDYIHTRIFSVYGPGDHPWSLIETCIRTFLANGNMEMGPCTQQWNFLYVQEAAQILVKLLLGKVPAGVYNVAGEDTRPLKSYIEEVYELCGRKGSYEFGYRPPNAEGCVSSVSYTHLTLPTIA